MENKLLPTDIFKQMSSMVRGQDDVLQKIAVSVYKHLNWVSGGNILLIGNSGTGKTTIMKTVQRFYEANEELQKYKSMAIMNANTLVNEEGEVNLLRMFKNIENDVRRRYGMDLTADELFEYMEHATVCLDEVDKISAKNYGKVNVTGLTIQHALLTVLEGESVLYETKAIEGGEQKTVRRYVDTSKMLFICGGAFEELYEQVYNIMVNKEDERRLKHEKYWSSEDLSLKTVVVFKLRESLKLSDLYTYGMVPQFISRFSSIGILDDLSRDHLKEIMLTARDSPFVISRTFFNTFGLDLELTPEALDFIAERAATNSRIGARALREVFDKVISKIEYDPHAAPGLSDDGQKIVIDIEQVRGTLETA